MDDSHKYFVQYMINIGSTPVSNALKYYQTLDPNATDILQLKKHISIINPFISKQFFKIVLTTCEVTGTEIIMWLNTKDDEVTRLSACFSKIELEYFHAILREIINSEDHCLTYMVCLNITSTLTAKLTRDNGQKVLNKWLKVGYFTRNKTYIYAGMKTICEFKSYLMECCPDSMCDLCSEIVLNAKECDHCGKFFHVGCINKFLQNHENCPSCRTSWKESEKRYSSQTDTQHSFNNGVDNEVNTAGPSGMSSGRLHQTNSMDTDTEE